MNKQQQLEENRREEEELRKNPINVYRCENEKCLEAMKEKDDIPFEEFKHHLFTVHNLKADQLKGTKQMIMHMDYSHKFTSTYQWILEGGLRFKQFIEMARAKDDIMRFDG